MNDIRHHCVERGAGEPLILLHGNGEDSGYFARQLEAFSPFYRVLAIDTRGHGRTERGTAPFTIRQFADDLLAFMDGRGIDRANLLGFSDGANIAMIFALRYPERVGRLILNGGNLDPRGIKRSVQIPIEVGYRAARIFAKRSTKARAKAELLGLMVNDPNLSAAELGRIQVPTLVIAGTRDMVREAHTRLIAAHIPGAELKLIDGDHFVASGNPEAFNRAVLDFLAR